MVNWEQVASKHFGEYGQGGFLDTDDKYKSLGLKLFDILIEP